MTRELKIYLELEQIVAEERSYTGDGMNTAIDHIESAMDVIWHSLSYEDKRFLDDRVIT